MLKERKRAIMAIHDTMDVLGGKWKLTIITALSFGEKRYSELLFEIEGISGKVLSRELKDLELNLLVNRTILKNKPLMVSYSLTEYSENILPLICNLRDWGVFHRQAISQK